MSIEEQKLTNKLSDIRERKDLLEAEEKSIETKLVMVRQGERIQRIINRGW